MKPVIVFDVNETLLDMGALDPTFGRIFGVDSGTSIRRRWFKQLLELFLTGIATGRHRPFADLTHDALEMIANEEGREVTGDDREALKTALGELPAHGDVSPGLDRLRADGFRIAALTNSSREAATRLLDRAGLLDRLEFVLSAEDVQRHKPAREAYEHAAQSLDVQRRDLLLVAAHAWDVAGAMAAGCRAAFVERPGQALSPGQPSPEFTARDLLGLTGDLVAKHG